MLKALGSISSTTEGRGEGEKGIRGAGKGET
jgi:hypothetical protein